MAVAACSSSGDAADAGPGGADAMVNPADTLCAPPYGHGADTCVQVASGKSIHLATLLDNTTVNQATGAKAVNPANGSDDRRGAEVARLLRPQSLGHMVEFVGPDMLVGLPNYRENCNDIDTTLDSNEKQAQAIISDGSIVAVLGVVCTNSGLQAAQPLTAGKILIVSVNNQGPAVTEPCPNDTQTSPPSCRTSSSFYARTSPNGKWQGTKLAAYATQKGWQKVVTVDDGSAFSHGLALSFASQFGGTTSNITGMMAADDVIRAINATGTPDFVWITNTSFASVTTLIAHARDGTAPDLAATTVVGASNVAQAKDLWQNPKGTVGSCPDPSMGGLGACADKLVVASIDRGFTNSSTYKDTFLPRYQTLSSGAAPPQNFHAFAFDAYNIVVDAIERVAVKNADGSLLIPRQKLRDDLLFNTSVAGLTSPAGKKLDCRGDAASGVNVGDCSQGADYFSVDTVACTGNDCNFVNQPL
jgi:ABC-type branched-subunit amino acid transport system substrate-binding protein